MKCPVCSDSDLKMAERQGIEIDYCPSCRGVWLDRGELDKIIERSSVAQPQAPVAMPRDADRRDGRYDDDRHYGKRKRKGGFLGELFDFD
ncbi:MAG: zf-TFIIB domain-containing protein [Burkholderiales bacterium]